MKGFILYPSYEIEDNKAYVLLYGKLENGKSFLTKNYTRPYFYIETSKLKKAQKLTKFDHEETNFKNFKGDTLTKVIIDLPKDIPALRQKLEKEEIKCYEADIRFAYRFMIDNELQGTIEIKGKEEKHDYVDFFFNEPELKPSQYSPQLKVLSLDIETASNVKYLYSISLYSKNYSKSFIVHNKKIKNAEVFKDEKSMLESFKEEFLKFDPDVITGWNVIDFDLKTLNDFFKKYKIDFTLSRSEKSSTVKVFNDFMKDSTADFTGRVVLDGIALMRTSFIKLDDYKLGTAASEFLGEKKLIADDNKVEKIESFYKNEPEKLIEYNLKDAELVYKILEKNKLIELTIKRSILTGMPLDRVKASVASLDSLYLRKLREMKLVAPSASYTEKEKPITGGYVMTSKPGIYDYILVLDFKSLYPSIMRTFNIDPLNYLGKKTSEKNIVKAANGAIFRNSEGVLPKLIETFMEARDEAKKEKDDIKSYAIKIHLNSFFGVLANPSCRFYNFDIANAITTSGHHIIKTTKTEIEKLGYEVIYGDTDSLFINSNAKTYEEADKVGKKIAKEINEFFKSYIKKEYKRESILELQFEKVYARFLMPKTRHSEEGSKKRYAGLLLKDNKEKIDFVGLESRRRDWTDLSKKFQLELLDRIFHKQEVSEFVKKFVDDLQKGKYDDLLVYKKALRKGIEGYNSITPPHLKAARKLKKITSNLIEYVLTTDGPEPIQNIKHKIDYDHYIDKQIKPIADSVLCFYNTSFDELISKQHSLFDFKN